MRNKRNRKLMSILLTLSMLVTLLVPMVGPAAASSTYAALGAPTVLNNGIRQALGVIQIDIPQTTVGTSTILVTLPTDFTVDQAVYTPSVSLGKTGSKLFMPGFINAISYVSAREFKVSYTVTTNNADYDVRLFLNLGKPTIPSSANGDIKVTMTKLAGDFSDGTVVVGKAGSGAVDTYINDTVTFTSAGTTGGAVSLYLKENTEGALAKSDTIPTAKFKLPAGMNWTGVVSPITNLTYGVATTVYATVGADNRVLEVKRPAANTDGKSLYKVTADISVDSSTAVLGSVDVAVSGNSSINQSTLKIGDYTSYSIKLVNAKDAKDVKPGRTNQDVGDFNIEEGTAGSILGGRDITMELPDGVKWATLNTPTAEGSLTNNPAITAVGSDGRKVKFTATNTSPYSKGKYKFTNVQVDVAVDFSGDIKVKVDGAGIDKQELVIGKTVKILTATADTPEVKIGLQSQAGGTIKIVEGAKEALINARELTVTAPTGVTWAKLPTVKVTDGDLAIDMNAVAKDGRVVTIPIKSQSTKASTIAISDVSFTIDRTVPEGDISLDLGGRAIDEINNTYTANLAAGVAPNRTYYATGPVGTNGFGTIFSGRTVAASVVVAKTVTPAPTTTKNKVVFKIGDTKFSINGKNVTMDAAPYLKNNRTYLPIRFVAQAVGITDNNIIWNDADQSVILIKDSTVVKLVIGSNTMTINGTSFSMDVAPEIVDPGRTMLPVRWVAQALGANINWDDATQTVTVN